MKKKKKHPTTLDLSLSYRGWDAHIQFLLEEGGDDWEGGNVTVSSVAVVFFFLSAFFELICILLYAYVFPSLASVKYFRAKAAAEGSLTVTADLAAGGGGGGGGSSYLNEKVSC